MCSARVQIKERNLATSVSSTHLIASPGSHQLKQVDISMLSLLNIYVPVHWKQKGNFRRSYPKKSHDMKEWIEEIK